MSEKKPIPEEDISPESEPYPEERETYDLLISQDEAETAEASDADVSDDLADERQFKTKYGEGHTYNPQQAADQGLTYTPPSDPPTLPSDDPSEAEVAAGFASSMEDSDPGAERLPPHVEDNDLDLQDDIYLSLRNNSETGHLTDIIVQVNRGVVNLLGTVRTEDDIARVSDVVQELSGVASVNNNLLVEVRP